MPASLLHARTAGLDIFSTQLATPPAQSTLRVRQVLAIDAAIRARHDPATPMPPVLCGDLSARPHSDEIRFLTGNAVITGRSTYYQDAWDVMFPTKPGFTVGPRTNARDEVLTAGSQRSDYVLVGEPFRRPGGAGRITWAALVFDDKRTGIRASSHHGLAVNILWPQRP